MTVFEKLRLWGLKGAISYVCRRFRERQIGKRFLLNAKLYPYVNPERGITVVGTLSNRDSLSKTLRDFCFSLKDANIPFQTWDLGSHNVHKEDVDEILTPKEDFRIARYSHLVEMVCSPVPDGIVKHRGRIVFWEFENGLLQGYPILMERPGDVIAMSDFNLHYYQRVFKGTRITKKILYPLRVTDSSILSKTEARAKFGIPENKFMVFFKT